jgi:hypothetical protein
MCGGGKKKAAAPVQQPVQMPYKVMADNSNAQRQTAAIAADAGKQPASYGSELGSAGMPATTGAA